MSASESVTGLTGEELTVTEPPFFRYGKARTASAGSNAMIASAHPLAISGEYAPSPMRTWLTTLPPRCAMPIVSAVCADSPRAPAADARIFDARTVP